VTIGFFFTLFLFISVLQEAFGQQPAQPRQTVVTVSEIPVSISYLQATFTDLERTVSPRTVYADAVRYHVEIFSNPNLQNRLFKIMLENRFEPGHEVDIEDVEIDYGEDQDPASALDTPESRWDRIGDRFDDLENPLVYRPEGKNWRGKVRLSSQGGVKFRSVFRFQTRHRFEAKAFADLHGIESPHIRITSEWPWGHTDFTAQRRQWNGESYLVSRFQFTIRAGRRSERSDPPDEYDELPKIVRSVIKKGARSMPTDSRFYRPNDPGLGFIPYEDPRMTRFQRR